MSTSIVISPSDPNFRVGPIYLSVYSGSVRSNFEILVLTPSSPLATLNNGRVLSVTPSGDSSIMYFASDWSIWKQYATRISSSNSAVRFAASTVNQRPTLSNSTWSGLTLEIPANQAGNTLWISATYNSNPTPVEIVMLSPPQGMI
jgi:hypothetical protein